MAANETTAPELTPEEQAAQDAHTATRAEEESWGARIEARLAALEEKAGLGQEKADAPEGATEPTTETTNETPAEPGEVN